MHFQLIWKNYFNFFFLQEDCNVICVDWSAGAIDPNYVRAAVNTRLVGKQVSFFKALGWSIFARTCISLKISIRNETGSNN